MNKLEETITLEQASKTWTESIQETQELLKLAGTQLRAIIGTNDEMLKLLNESSELRKEIIRNFEREYEIESNQ